MDDMHTWIEKALAAALTVFLWGVILWLLWPVAAVDAFSAPPLTFWQAVALTMLVRMFGPHEGGS